MYVNRVILGNSMIQSYDTLGLGDNFNNFIATTPIPAVSILLAAVHIHRLIKLQRPPRFFSGCRQTVVVPYGMALSRITLRISRGVLTGGWSRWLACPSFYFIDADDAELTFRVLSLRP